MGRSGAAKQVVWTLRCVNDANGEVGRLRIDVPAAAGIAGSDSTPARGSDPAPFDPYQATASVARSRTR